MHRVAWSVATIVSCLSLMLAASGCGADSHLATESATSFAAFDRQSTNTFAAPKTTLPEANGNDRIVAATPRRVIYTADVSLQTREFDKAERSIPELVKNVGGYLTEISLNRQHGEQRQGRWQARVPAEHFQEFLEGLDEVGVPDHRQVSGQDVTEEYVDLETRLANKKRLEERLLDLMKAKSASVADVIEFERQVAQVREEIERMEGRFRYLMNRSDLSTISISLREVHEYVPPQEPTFATRLTETWSGTVGTFRGWGEGSVLGMLRALPWLSLMLPLGMVIAIGRRFTMRLMSVSKTHAP